LTRRRVITAALGTPLVLRDAVERCEAQEDGTRSAQQFSVEAGGLLLRFSTGKSGVKLLSLTNRRKRFEHLAQPSQLFGISKAVDEPFLRSDHDFNIETVEAAATASGMTLKGAAASTPVSFVLSLLPDSREDVVLLNLALRNHGTARQTFWVRSPWIQGLRLQASSGPMGVVLPQEAGGVVRTGRSAVNLGMQVNPKLGLPTAMNTMELLSMYDPEAHGGIFFCDAEADLDSGASPAQFTFVEDTVCGHSLIALEPGQSHTLPACAIGVHDTGDWHHAVDQYIARHRRNWRFPDVPSWFKDQGAIYSFSGSGAGAIYMEYPQQDLALRISSFEQLPRLLDEAGKLGTNIVYLWDYWEGVAEGGRPPYWNKGDYVPRTDLGGATAFKNGILKLHEAGGRIILYVEPFIIFKYSDIGKQHGEAWAGRDASGALYHQYPQNYPMVSCLPVWQNFIVDKAKSLVRNFEADGIYLDSWGWQMNWPMKTSLENVLYNPFEYNEGVLALATKVREAIRSVRPDAIVMGESTSGALSRCWDGGLSADFAWLRRQNQDRIIGSPVRYGMPEVNIFTNGRNLNELNQVFAAGYNLALLNANLPDSDYIRKLVQIRQTYKDALIYGRQVCQPKTLNESVPAYYYRGSAHEIIIAVNLSSQSYSGSIQWQATHGAASKWHNLLSNDLMTASDGHLQIELAAHSLLVLALTGEAKHEQV